MLRLWEVSRECVVLGRSGRVERDVNATACESNGVPVLRRSSGGGAVLLGPGCLNYTLILPLVWDPRWRDVRYSLSWIMNRMTQVLAVPDLACAGESDLALHGRKVSGNAQRRTQQAILHHGTLLYDFDVTRPELFLASPYREPFYRRGRAHRDFLANLPLAANEIRRRLLRAWCGDG